MHSSLPLLFGIIAIASASPFERRTVAALNTAAFDEAQQKDNTAARAFSGTSIKVCHASVREVRADADHGRLAMDGAFLLMSYRVTFAPT